MLNLKDKTDLELIEIFTKIRDEFKNRNLIRSSNFTGDLGEYIALNYFNNDSNLPNLILTSQSNQHVDALDEKGNRYAIKTLTSKTTGVFYGLNSPKSTKEHSKIFDYAIIVKLDKAFSLEKILLLDWNTFILSKGWHKTMQAYNLSLTKKLESRAQIYYAK